MNFMRVGLHAGLTVRIETNTDLSLGYAHFFYEVLEIQLNPDPEGKLPFSYTLTDEKKSMYRIKEGELDGTARVYIEAGDEPGRYFANAGTYRYNLDVVGLSLAHHF
jgi:hypothetical protein